MKLRFLILPLCIACNMTFGQNVKPTFFKLTDTTISFGSICDLDVNPVLSDTSLDPCSVYPFKDSIAIFMKKNVSCSIEFSTYNDTISYKRLKLIIDCIVRKGIQPDRLLIYNGNNFKKSRYVSHDLVIKYPFLQEGTYLTDEVIAKLNSKKSQEIANSLNDRVELRVLDYQPVKIGKDTTIRINAEHD